MLRIVRRKAFPSVNTPGARFSGRKEFTQRRPHRSAAKILARGLRQTLRGFRRGSMSLRAARARRGRRGYLR